MSVLVLLYSKVGCELEHPTALLCNRQVVDVLQPWSPQLFALVRMDQVAAEKSSGTRLWYRLCVSLSSAEEHVPIPKPTGPIAPRVAWGFPAVQGVHESGPAVRGRRSHGAAARTYLLVPGIFGEKKTHVLGYRQSRGRCAAVLKFFRPQLIAFSCRERCLALHLRSARRNVPSQHSFVESAQRKVKKKKKCSCVYEQSLSLVWVSRRVAEPGGCIQAWQRRLGDLLYWVNSCV